MGRTKEVTTGFVDTRSNEERQLNSIVVNRNVRDLTEEEKRNAEKLIRDLDEKGIKNEFKGVGKCYAVRVDGDEDLITFRLVVANPEIFGKVPEVSIVSPMGNAVRNLQEGEATSYKVNKRDIVITLIAVADTYDELLSKTTSKDPVKKIGTME